MMHSKSREQRWECHEINNLEKRAEGMQGSRQHLFCDAVSHDKSSWRSLYGHDF